MSWVMSLTNASQPAKLKVGDKPKIQEGLEFISSVSVMENKYYIQFYQNTWQTLNKTYKQLYVDFICENPDHVVGYGTFLALKPFYIRPVKNMISEYVAVNSICMLGGLLTLS